MESFGLAAEVGQVLTPQICGKQPRSGMNPISQRRPRGIKLPESAGLSPTKKRATKKQRRQPEADVVVRRFKAVAAHARDFKAAVSRHNKAQVAANETDDDVERNKHEAERDRQLALIRETEAVLASGQFTRFDASESMKKSKLAGHTRNDREHATGGRASEAHRGLGQCSGLEQP